MTVRVEESFQEEAESKLPSLECQLLHYNTHLRGKESIKILHNDFDRLALIKSTKYILLQDYELV